MLKTSNETTLRNHVLKRAIGFTGS